MNAALLLEHYGRIADAPNAIARLRRFILDLAVRGKLVKQDPNDEASYSALTEARLRLRHDAEVASRVRWKSTEPVQQGEIGKDLPHGWVAARVNDTGLYINGLAFKPADWKRTGKPIIRIQNLTDPTKDFNYTEGSFPDEVIVRDGDILVSWSATLDAFRWSRGEGVLNQHIFRVIPASDLTEQDFLLLLLRNAIREMSESEHAHGLVMSHINRGPFLNHIVLIPPRAEQRRIAEKFSELMALCDRLDVAQVDREIGRNKLTLSTFAKLNEPDPESFVDDARFVLDQLGPLTKRTDQIKQLRQMILNLAVKGCLTKQSSGDAPIDAVVDSITGGKAARRSATGNGPPADLPFDIPSNWLWTTLGRVISSGPQNGLSPRPSNAPDAVKAITLTATTSGRFNPAHFKTVDAQLDPNSDFWLQDGDLLFQRGNTREYVGMAAIYHGPERTFIYPDLIMKVRVADSICLPFIHLAAISPYARAYMAENATGAQETMPKINQGMLVNLPIPLPPVAEQHRIVAKVDELMTLCDQLEASLIEGEQTRSKLLEAVLHEALEPA